MGQQVPLLVGVAGHRLGHSSRWALVPTRLDQAGLATGRQGSKGKQARPLETYSQNRHSIISATSYWPERVPQPSQSTGRHCPLLEGAESHIVKGGVQGGVDIEGIFESRKEVV